MKRARLKFAVIGCGFWAGYQIPAWLEFGEEVELIALYNREIGRAKQLAELYRLPYCYDHVDALFDELGSRLDFVDIITDVGTHALFAKKAAERGLHVITQKPMTDNPDTAIKIIDYCKHQHVRLLVHENFRWQAPIRAVKKILDSRVIGDPFKCRLSFTTGYPVFENQPALRDLDRLIIADLGSHMYDISRFLFGEVSHLYCQTRSINKGIKGEDVANTLMTHISGVQNFVEMSFATIMDPDPFSETQLLIEGNKGSILLGRDFKIQVTTNEGVDRMEAKPIQYDWANPDYAVVHSSIVDCNRNLLDDLLGLRPAETSGDDNYKTMKLVNAAYESARTNEVVNIQ
jgi:D-apiose dehydrogenase